MRMRGCVFLCLNTRYPPCLPRRSESALSSKAGGLERDPSAVRDVLMIADHVARQRYCQPTENQLLVLPNSHLRGGGGGVSRRRNLCRSWAGDPWGMWYSCRRVLRDLGIFQGQMAGKQGRIRFGRPKTREIKRFQEFNAAALGGEGRVRMQTRNPRGLLFLCMYSTDTLRPSP